MIILIFTLFPSLKTHHFHKSFLSELYAGVRLCSKLWDIFSTTRMRSVFYTAYIAAAINCDRNLRCTLFSFGLFRDSYFPCC